MYQDYYTLRYRIYPTNEQAKRIDMTAIACKRIYGVALQDMITHHKETGQLFIPNVRMYRQEHHLDLKDIDPLALSNSLLHLRRVFNQYLSANQYPQPIRAKNRLSYNTAASKVMIQGKRIDIPYIGAVKIVLHRPLPEGEKALRMTLTKNASGQYFVSLLYARPRPYPNDCNATEDNTIGLDYSVPKFYVDSDGNSPNHPHFLEEEKDRIERIQRKLKGMKKGSKNYTKEERKLFRLYEKIHNRRMDWLHKESKRLADKYDYVSVEDLDLQNIAALYSLGKRTIDNSYRCFIDLLDYKMRAQGKQLIKINRWIRSSQICHKCGFVNKALTLSVRFWDCPKCGNHNSRDHNAALNIKGQVLKYLS